MDIFPFQACYPDLTQIESTDRFFSEVKEKYVAFKKEHLFKELPLEGLFINRIHTPNGSFTGLIGTIPVQEYTNGNILRHELTITSKKEKTAQLLLKRQASIKPVLLAYSAVPQITQLLQDYIAKNPVFQKIHLPTSEEVQEYWKIDQANILLTLQQLFKEQVAKTYIADGHHRAATMSLLKERFQQQQIALDFGHILVALFDSNQLKIYPFNRIVKVLDRLSPSTFLTALSEFANIQLLDRPTPPKEQFTFLFLLEKKWYQAQWKASLLADKYNKSKVLDVQLLNDFVLEKIIGITDVQTDKRIIYQEGTSGIAGLAATTEQHPDTIGFQLFPIPVADFIHLSDQQQLLPPKSTYFMPRIKNGMLIKQAKFINN